MILFMLFLSTPTIVGLIEKCSDTSAFYNMAEEEISHKQLTAEFLFEESYEVAKISTEDRGAIHAGQNLQHDNIDSSIVIPPPEQV